VKIVEILVVHIVSMEQGYLSQYGVWLRTGRPGDRGSIPGSEAHPASCPMDTGGPFPGVKARPLRDANHSSLSSAEAVNE
jgi:hypothetical protein